jgi:putative alpha-1,2-mannosidase
VAGQSLFLVNAPAFERAVLQVGGNEFVVETSGHREHPTGADGAVDTPPTQYVRRASLNGTPLTGSHLSAAELHRGGVLHVELGPEPTDWGQAVRPPSVSPRSVP